MPGRKTIIYNLTLFFTIGLLLTISIAYWQIEKQLITDIYKHQNLKYQAVSNTFNHWEEQQLKFVESLAATLGDFENIQAEQTDLQFFIKETIAHQDFEYLVIGLENGFYLSNPWKIPVGYDHRTRPWYTASKQSLLPKVVGPISSIESNYPDKTYISFTAPIIKDGVFIGVVSGDTSNNFLREIVLSHIVGEEEDLFIVNSNYQVALHEGTDPELGRAISEFEDIKHQITPNSPVWASQSFKYRFHPMGNTGWQMVFPLDKHALYQTLIIEAIKLAGWFALILIVIAGLVAVYNRKILKPLLKYYSNDDNTGLMGKKSFKYSTEQRIQKDRSPALLLIISINKFGALLSAHGQSTINGLLRQATSRIEHYLQHDASCGFFSEGRFIVFAPFVDIDNDAEVKRWLHELTQKLSAPYLIDGQENLLSFSIGASRYPADNSNIDTLISMAFTAISRRGKKEISNYYLFIDEDRSQISGQVIMNRTLHQAINKNELYMVYQPQFCGKTNEVIGVESLVRWYSSSMQREVYPNEFIPLAEQSDLMLVLGRWVIQAVVKQIAEWQQQEIDFGIVAINISPDQLTQPDFVKDTIRCLEHYNVSPKKVCLEITETHIIANPSYISTVLSELKGYGFTIAIDDFGTGYSSLEYLKHLPVDKIKIDRSFVKDIEHCSEDQEITRLIINIAHVFNFSLIAEGVENQEQANILLNNGCSEMQGFHYAKPMRPEDLVSQHAQPWHSNKILNNPLLTA